jgi:hypothetical protein
MGTAGLRKSGKGWLGFEVVDGVVGRWVNMVGILGVLVVAELSVLAKRSRSFRFWLGFWVGIVFVPMG